MVYQYVFDQIGIGMIAVWARPLPLPADMTGVSSRLAIAPAVFSSFKSTDRPPPDLR